MIIKFVFNELSIDSIVTSNRYDNLKMQSMNERFRFVKTGKHLIRSMEYYDYMLKSENFNSSHFDKVIEHWGKREKMLVK